MDAASLGKNTVAESIFDPTFRLADTLILASLSRQPRYGYELEGHIVNISYGRISPGWSTTYKALRRLARQGFIKELDRLPGDRRRYYDITESGRAQLGRDLALMRGIVRAFDMRLV
jgi:DNA-binding PadR family transcriptional regulator